jgi:hypothetical protein
VDGRFSLTLCLGKSNDLFTFAPFPVNAPDVSVDGSGKIVVEFQDPDDTAFFRLQAE